MACNLLSRLFRRRGRLSLVSDLPTPPALPAHTDKLQLERSLEQLGIHSQDQNDLFYLGNLSEQGSCTLVVPGLPFGPDHSQLQRFQHLPGFIKLEANPTDNQTPGIDVFIHFLTAADAAAAMAEQPVILSNDGSSRRLQFHTGNAEAPTERPAKRRKTDPVTRPPKCLICREEITGTSKSPCLFCKAEWCHDCLKTNFSLALADSELFPVKCCGKVVHFDVVRGHISPTEYSKYKFRFEEHNTTKPVYCANIACSEFLPPRVSQPNERKQVQCFSCNSLTCGECRVLVGHENAKVHRCTTADEMTALLKQFDYKRCPRCSTGVAKMFGCSHIRCQCGAHWCWDCQRAIQICWSKPCARAIHEDDSEDEGSPGLNAAETDQRTDQADTETEQRTVQPDTGAEGRINQIGTEDQDMPQLLIARETIIPISNESNVARTEADPPATTLIAYNPPACLAPPPEPQASSAPAEIISPQINLDAEDYDDWEAASVDFGDEPVDESWDTWGCWHTLTPFHSVTNQQIWLSQMQDESESASPGTKRVCCLRCYKDVTIEDPAQEKKAEPERKDSAVDVSTPAQSLSLDESSVATEPLTENGQKVKRKGKGKGKKRDMPQLFNCLNCGMFFCGDCKKITEKELKEQRNQYLIRD